MFVEIAAPDRASTALAGRGRPGPARRIAGAAPPYLYLVPAVVFLVVWTYRPFAQTVELSFYRWNLLPTSPMEPVGLDNYRQVLELPELRQALVNTAWYVLGLLPFSVLIPVLIALLAQNVRGRGQALYRALIFVPTLVTPVATAAVWRWLLEPDGGPVTRALEVFGIGPVNVFREPGPAMVAMIGICGWQMIGFAVVVVTAGLSGINRDYADAASLDGATRAQITRRITLPLLSPSLVFLALMTILLSAQWTFPLIDTLTQGGPGGATTNVYYLLWQFGFRSFDAGYAAAAGTVFFVGFAVVAMFFVRLADRLSFHDD
ncbi:sugar ABC transporter permease [Streptomyces sp. SID3343]|uniref:ABC transporter permease subunit n=1 Tax=Streptomyces sp. SID3343 TaxID=2690260 RepID=UPI001368430F|nr:ABC transporter permease subunit [Streptomyces sp. SID3343]